MNHRQNVFLVIGFGVQILLYLEATLYKGFFTMCTLKSRVGGCVGEGAVAIGSRMLYAKNTKSV